MVKAKITATTQNGKHIKLIVDIYAKTELPIQPMELLPLISTHAQSKWNGCRVGTEAPLLTKPTTDHFIYIYKNIPIENYKRLSKELKQAQKAGKKAIKIINKLNKELKKIKQEWLKKF